MPGQERRLVEREVGRRDDLADDPLRTVDEARLPGQRALVCRAVAAVVGAQNLRSHVESLPRKRRFDPNEKGDPTRESPLRLRDVTASPYASGAAQRITRSPT